MDDDYNYIMFEYNMNYSIESIRHGYLSQKQKKETRISDNLLKKLGYSDKDILERND